MSELTLKRPAHRPSPATLEQKGAIHGVLSLFPRRSREYRIRRGQFAVDYKVHPRTIDNWYGEIERRKASNSTEAGAA